VALDIGLEQDLRQVVQFNHAQPVNNLHSRQQHQQQTAAPIAALGSGPEQDPRQAVTTKSVQPVNTRRRMPQHQTLTAAQTAK